MSRQSNSQTTKKQPSITTKLPASLDRALRQHVVQKDTDLSKFARAAFKEKLQREGALPA